MNKKSLILLIIIVVIIVGVGIYFYFSTHSTKNKDKQSNYEANKTVANTSIDNSAANSTEENKNNESNIKEEHTNLSSNEQPQKNQPQYHEEQLTTFSTKIYSNDSARQNNISITCNTLNGTTVKNGSTFSFCGTVGQATSKKGYQEADIYDNNGKKKKGLGRW